MINFSSKGKVHHSSSTRTKAKSTPEKPSPSKKALSHSPLKKSGWHNIFETSKAMLCFSPRSINCPDIIVKFAQPSFWQTFGLFTTPNFDTPFKLRQLFGATSKREIPFLVESAVMTGQSVSEYVNLHRQDGVALSCHITVRSITGEKNEESLDADRSLEEKWAVMTVRSASSVGNACFSGIGLLGTARVTKEYMDSIMGAQQSSTSLLSLSSSSSPVKQLLSMEERTQHCP